ncbi:hypothetical protein MBLNU13_g07404t1 [Cladosporium sp. NU13]
MATDSLQPVQDAGELGLSLLHVDDSRGLWNIPLGFKIDRLYGHLDTSGSFEKGTIALGNWYRLVLHLYVERDMIEGVLDEDDLQIVSLLRDWWIGRYQDPGASLGAVLKIVDQSEDLAMLRFANEEQMRRVLDYLELRRWPKHETFGLLDGGLRAQEYNYLMGNLFFLEFEGCARFRGAEVQSRIQQAVADSRKLARQSSYTQRLAIVCFQNATRSVRAGKGLDFLDCVPDRPLDNPLSKGPGTIACPWLPQTTQSRTSLPYYLWDVQRQRTIETSALLEWPHYTCVSHTWGRWRSKTGEVIRLEGVPWPIPCNDKFNVSELPTHMAKVPSATPYVWFDLLCIPQQDNQALTDREIERQGKIFQNAQCAIIWLNDRHISDLNGIKYALLWTCLHFLETHESSNAHNDKWEILEKVSSKALCCKSNLFATSKTDFNQLNHQDLNPWFTSLWTLQEICLRPDMWLCSPDWKCLSLDGLSALSFDGLICVWRRFNRPRRGGARGQGLPESLKKSVYNLTDNKQSMDRRRPFTEIHRCIGLTKLEFVLDMTRAGILALGDQRVCTGKRAEAIMAALGATEWHEPGQDNDRDLVLAKYPLRFIEEVQWKIPAEFWTLHKLTFPMTKPIEYQDRTLLPFDSGINLFVASHPGYAHAPLPSIRRWTVQAPSGFVKIKEACIVCSSDTNRASLPENTMVEVEGSPSSYLEGLRPIYGIERDHVGDISAWMRQQPFQLHLVALSANEIVMPGDSMKRMLEVFGCIFKEFTSSRLAKVGFFELNISPDVNSHLIPKWRLPASSKVDWEL